MTRPNVTPLLDELRALGSAEKRASMIRTGIKADGAFGVSIYDLRKVAQLMTNAVQDFGALLNAASSGLSTLGDRVLKPLHVTSAQWKVLVVLARRGPSRVSDLVQVLEHDQAAISRLVTRMETTGLVARRDDPDDARAGVVVLTPRGEKTYHRCDEKLRAVMGSLQRSLKPREQQVLRELLTKFTAAIDAALDASS